jgi:uncharacterized membrane protein
MSENGSIKYYTGTINLFCIGYWFIWNHSFAMIPKMAAMAVKLGQVTTNITGIDFALHSDSLGQVLMVCLLMALSLAANGHKAINQVTNTWNWAPLLLVAGQLWLYGGAKLAGVQFIALPDIVNHATREIVFWQMAGRNETLIIMAGLVQVIIAISLWIPKIRRMAGWAALACFIFIVGLNIYFEIHVMIHAIILLMVSAYIVWRGKKSFEVSPRQALVLSIVFAALLAEGAYYLI